MSQQTDAPFGTWPSPITADVLLAGAVGLSNPRVFDGILYWTEARPAEAGRTTIVRRCADGTIEDCLPPPWNARSRVHEYGGICYAVHDDVLYFTHFDDQRIHARALHEGAADPTPLSAEDGRRWADFEIDARRGRLIAVGELERMDDEPRNFIAALPLDGSGGVVELATGHDFFAAPRLSPAGDRLAWLAWDHPAMPWDGTTLHVAPLDDAGHPGDPVAVAGGPEESVFQPEWTPAGTLVFVSDRSGWWNLYRTGEAGIEALAPMDADFGLPLWVFGMRTWVPLDDDRIACCWHTADGDQLGILTPGETQPRVIPLPDRAFDGIAAGDGRLFLVAAAPDRFPEIITVDPTSGARETLRRASDLRLDPAALSLPEAITFPTGPEPGAVAHAYFYRPTHPLCRGAPGERPPLLVISHGGPTAAASPTLNLKIQYWTSRGFAVLDVNYRGSTGYGRAYRDALKGGWGETDVTDCVAAARFVAERGDVDPERMAIRGSSAGGLTTLAALAFHDLFRAGVSLYGVADLGTLAEDTHKFESRYLDSMVGPWPQARARYEARSPRHHVDRMNRPVLFLQGLEDRIVPPSQAEAMVEALDARGIPVAYVTFEGEQHGFRRADTIRRALEAELYFYGRIFGFTPAGPIEPIEIRNLP
jgi:dipeptidyl aminopeptidase/acylaminoacyl peptidase